MGGSRPRECQYSRMARPSSVKLSSLIHSFSTTGYIDYIVKPLDFVFKFLDLLVTYLVHNRTMIDDSLQLPNWSTIRIE